MQKLSVVPVAIASSLLTFTLSADCSFPYEAPALVYAPPAAYGSCCSFEGHVDYLYLKAKFVGDGLFYGINPTVNTDASALAIEGFGPNINHKEIYVDWDVGYNIGFGWRLPCDEWGIDLNWLHFNSHTSFDLPFKRTGSTLNLKTALGQSSLVAYPDTGTLQNYSLATTTLGLHLNLLDLAVSRKFAVGPSLWLRPKAGILALFIQDEFSLGLGQGRFAKAIQHVEGAGVLFGLNSEWNWCCGLSVYGGFDFGAVGYRLKVDQNQIFNGDTELVVGNHYKVDQFDPLFRYQLGGSWEIPLCSDTMSLSLSLGWEALFLLNHDHIVRFAFSEAKPLVLQGLSFSVALSI